MDTKTTATLRYLRMTPRKVRLVADFLKGLSVIEAEAQLMYERRRAARPILKLLRSAVANAKQSKLDADRLYIERVNVDQGPMLKRTLPRARGIATPIQKKMSHVTIVLAERREIVVPRFKISVPKRVKLPPREKPRKKKPEVKEIREETQAKKPGFFRRFFRRKSV